jgi:hypothetical protein
MELCQRRGWPTASVREDRAASLSSASSATPCFASRHRPLSASCSAGNPTLHERCRVRSTDPGLGICGCQIRHPVRRRGSSHPACRPGSTPRRRASIEPVHGCGPIRPRVTPACRTRCFAGESGDTRIGPPVVAGARSKLARSSRDRLRGRVWSDDKAGLGLDGMAMARSGSKFVCRSVIR